jgi:hypothetical protein
MEKKQTAVEWLIEKINKDLIHKSMGQIYGQAKQMEKEQMKEAHLIADHYPRGYEFDKWYNETYGGTDE